MTKSVIYAFLILNILTCNAQESILFKQSISPSKKYTSDINTTSTTEITIDGSEEMMANFKDRGITMTIISEGNSHSQTYTVTQKRDKKGEIPATITYGEMISTTTTNGKVDVQKNPLEGVNMLVTYDKENILRIDSILSDAIDPQMKSMMKNLVESLQQSIKFPDKPMKVGDSFYLEIPLTIPIAGMNPITMKINTTYFLKKIKGNLAYFDIEQTISMDMNEEEYRIAASGSGDGKIEYDITESYMTKYSSNLPMVMTFNMGEAMTMSMKMQSKTIQITTIK